MRSGTLDAPAIRGLRGRGGGHGQPPGRGGRPAGRAPRRPDRPGARGRARRDPQRPARRTGPAARQRALLLPGLRGRRAADAARRQGHRLLDRLGLHRRRGPAQSRAARHGRGRRPGPAARCGSRWATPPRRRTWTRWARPSARSSSGPAAPPAELRTGRGFQSFRNEPLTWPVPRTTGSGPHGVPAEAVRKVPPQAMERHARARRGPPTARWPPERSRPARCGGPTGCDAAPRPALTVRSSPAAAPRGGRSRR